MIGTIRNLFQKKHNEPATTVTNKGAALNLSGLVTPGKSVKSETPIATQEFSLPAVTQAETMTLRPPVPAEPSKPAVNPLLGITIKKVSNTPVESEQAWSLRMRREQGLP